MHKKMLPRDAKGLRKEDTKQKFSPTMQFNFLQSATYQFQNTLYIFYRQSLLLVGVNKPVYMYFKTGKKLLRFFLFTGDNPLYIGRKLFLNDKEVLTRTALFFATPINIFTAKMGHLSSLCHAILNISNYDVINLQTMIKLLNSFF